jgi:hypothetical protein
MPQLIPFMGGVLEMLDLRPEPLFRGRIRLPFITLFLEFN